MINNYLKIYFIEKGISQHEVARRTGIQHSKINLMLNNKRKLSAEELLLIAKIFDIDLNKIKEN